MQRGPLLVLQPQPIMCLQCSSPTRAQSTEPKQPLWHPEIVTRSLLYPRSCRVLKPVLSMSVSTTPFFVFFFSSRPSRMLKHPLYGVHPLLAIGHTDWVNPLLAIGHTVLPQVDMSCSPLAEPQVLFITPRYQSANLVVALQLFHPRLTTHSGIFVMCLIHP